jgi:hypothetical protein
MNHLLKDYFLRLVKRADVKNVTKKILACIMDKIQEERELLTERYKTGHKDGYSQCKKDIFERNTGPDAISIAASAAASAAAAGVDVAAIPEQERFNFEQRFEIYNIGFIEGYRQFKNEYEYDYDEYDTPTYIPKLPTYNPRTAAHNATILEAMKQPLLLIFNSHEFKSFMSEEEEILEDIKRVTIFPQQLIYTKHSRNSRVILAAIQQQPNIMARIPEDYLTFPLLKEILEKDGKMLQFIGPLFKTADLCLIALRQTADALDFIPRHILYYSPESTSFFEIIIVQYPQHLHIVPRHMLTEDLIRKILSNNPNAIYVAAIKQFILSVIPDYQDEPVPPFLQRQMSKTHTDQGDEGVCGRHAFSRVIIKNFFELILPLVYTSDYTKNSCNDILKTKVVQSELLILRKLTPENCSPGGYLKILLFLHLFFLFQQHIETVPGRPIGWLNCIQVSALYKHVYNSIEIPGISSKQHTDLMDALHTLQKIQTKYRISLVTFHFSDVTIDNIKKITDHGLYLMLRIDSTEIPNSDAAHFVIIVGAFGEYMLLKNSWDSDLIYKIKLGNPFYLGHYRYDKTTHCSFVIPVEQDANEDFEDLTRVDEYLERYEQLKSKLNNVVVNVVQSCPSQDKEPEECENDQHYRRQALLFHPDKNTRCREAATLKFKRLKTLKGCKRDEPSTKRLLLTAGKTHKRRFKRLNR